MRVSQLKASHVGDVWHSDPGGSVSSDLGSVSVFVQMHRMADPRERKIKLVMKPWAYVKDMKDQLQAMFGLPTSAQQLFHKGIELANARNLVQCGLYQEKVVVDLVLSANGRKNRTNVFTIHPYGNHVFPKSIMKAAHLAMQGLALGLTPELAMDGTGGTYFLKDPSQRKVCCFKPQNEEPFGPCNPRGFVGPLGKAGFRKGVLSGEACEREVAAYLLDKDHFAGVPATTLAEIKHPAFKYSEGDIEFKMGSLQEFVRHEDVASDLSPSLFTPHQVHKIVLLDMRLVNTDRNDANLLVRRRRNANGQTEHELIPIDHGYSIPDTIEIAWCDWCWYNWPQLKVPMTEEDRQYILSLNVDMEIQTLLTQVPLRPACQRNLKIAGLLVQKGVQKRVLLHDLARIMCRDDMDSPSKLEQMITDALHQALNHPVSSSTSFSLGATSPKPSSLRIDTSVLPPPAFGGGASSTANSGMKSPLGFWASLDPFENPPRRASLSPAFSPRADTLLPSWQELSQGFHADAKELFASVAITFDSLPPRGEKQFFQLLDRLLDAELDHILDSYDRTN